MFSIGNALSYYSLVHSAREKRDDKEEAARTSVGSQIVSEVNVHDDFFALRIWR